MPLNTQIERKGEALPVRWGEFHVACMVLAAAWDSGEGPFTDNTDPRDRDEKPKFANGDELDYPVEPYPVSPREVFNLVMYPIISATPLNSGEYVLKREHRFVDVTDGEVLELLPGDVLKAWRN